MMILEPNIDAGDARVVCEWFDAIRKNSAIIEIAIRKNRTSEFPAARCDFHRSSREKLVS